MVESVLVTLLPLGFVTLLFGGGKVFRRRNVNMDGDPPIDKLLFSSSKYLILVVWVAMVVHGWGGNLSFVPVPNPVRWIALFLWGAGFLLLFTGRLRLGDSFRIGSAQERTNLTVDGLFRFSRNPMYLGVYATLVATVLYTLNPLLLAVAVYIVVVHHKIVLAEEKHLRAVFGAQYTDYCGRVRRYL